MRRIIVSTDSKQIAGVALAFGAEVPFIRPDYLAKDDSPEWLAWQHALKEILKEEGALPEALLSLPTTSPLRELADVNSCLDCFEKGCADAVITVCPSRRSPYFNMVNIDEERSAKLVLNTEEKTFRRQDTPATYDITTVAYVMKPSFVMQSNHIFDGQVQGIVVPENRSLDIDTKLDFDIAEFLMRRSLLAVK